MNESVHGVTKLCDIPDPIEGKKNHMTSLLSVDGACKFWRQFDIQLFILHILPQIERSMSTLISLAAWWRNLSEQHDILLDNLMLSFIHKWINDIMCAVHFDEQKWNFIISVWVWKYRETYMSKIEREKNEKITIPASLIKMSLAWRSLPFVCMWICTWNPGCYKDLNWAWHGVFRSARSSESTVK